MPWELRLDAPLPQMEETTTAETAKIYETRAAIGRRFLRGRGFEVGAGSRLYLNGAEVQYGDIRHGAPLKQYFHGAQSPVAARIDAQTFSGFPERTLDFVISAHVIEHLRDPIGALVNALGILKPGGIHRSSSPICASLLISVGPKLLLLTFSQTSATTVRVVCTKPTRSISSCPSLPDRPGVFRSRNPVQASESAKRWREFDIHFHAWTKAGFEALLDETSKISSFRLRRLPRL